MTDNNKGQLFSLKSEEENNENQGSNLFIYENREDEIKISSHKLGFQEAGKVLGNPRALYSHLDALHQKHIKEIRDKEEQQEEAKKPHREKIDELTTDKEVKDTKRDKLNQTIEKYNTEISELKDEKRKIRENPTEFLGRTIDPNARVSFIIGVFILFFLTIYLILFYSSASYSAFFRQIQADLVVTQTIFDPKAFIKAFEKSEFTLALISTIPFVFLALGFLIHKFQENQQDYWRYAKVATLILTTFLFDALLAYQIEDKIYDATKTINDPPFNLEIASVSPEFWIIIFAGFVVYLIWGFVFDFTIKEHRNINAVERAIQKRDDNIDELKEKISNKEGERDDLDVEIRTLNSQIDREKAIINNNYFSYPQDYQLLHTHYMKGWIAWMVGNECSNEEIQQANDVSDKKLKNAFEPLNRAKDQKNEK